MRSISQLSVVRDIISQSSILLPMINVTRLNGKPIVVNADQIRSVEENPDTTITLLNGDRIIVKESMKEIVGKAIDFGRHLRNMFPPS